MDFKEYFDIKNIKGQYQKAVAESTANTLIEFCGQEQEFEQAIEQSGKSFQECLDFAVKDIKQSCSDFEIYEKAVKFYFSTAKIRVRMTIDLIGKTESRQESSFGVSLDSLLDF